MWTVCLHNPTENITHYIDYWHVKAQLWILLYLNRINLRFGKKNIVELNVAGYRQS